MKRIILFWLLTIAITVISSQDTEAINEAVTNGDCLTLYNYIQNGQGTEQKLISAASATLRKYTSIDSGTSKYRTDKMDSKVRNVGKDLMEKIFIDPELNLPLVVTKLVTGISDQFLKAKVLHDWICDNIAYDADMLFKIRYITGQDYISVLKKKKAVCSGYTNLYNKMCELAGIKSIGINGYSKGFGYDGDVYDDPDHDWNAVYLGGKWYLIDVTWDAGHVDNQSFIKKYSTEWLFLDSRLFLYSHLPSENKYQFYAPIVTKEKFIEEPYIKGVFFKYGLELKSELPLYNNLIDDNYSFDILLKNVNVMLTSTVRTPEQVNVDGSDWQGRSGNTISFVFDVPDTRDYKGFVFARLKNSKRIQERIDIRTFETKILPAIDQIVNDTSVPEKSRKITAKEQELFIQSYYKIMENGYYYYLEDLFDTPRINAVIKIHSLVDLSLEMLESVLDFNIKAKQDYQGYKTVMPVRFPQTFTGFSESIGTKLISPIKGELKEGAEEYFAFDSKDFVKFAIIIDGQFNFLNKNKDGIHELTFTIPEGVTNIQIFGTKNNKNYNGLIQYAVVK
jgi:hypothetical protein